jgi:plasmid maintenance system antidote protein VapI
MHNPPHPGKVLREYLGKMEIAEAAKRLGVGPATIRRMRAAERAERGRDENGVPTDAPEAVS